MMLSAFGSFFQSQAAVAACALTERIHKEHEDMLRQSLVAFKQRSLHGRHWHTRHVPLIRAHEARNGAV